jgi:uncharacterized membrane protein
MRRRRLRGEDERRVVTALAGAERGNRGEVRVHLEGRCPGGEPLARATALFAELGMRATADDTGVLLYVAERDRKAAVYAGAGIHGAGDADFWQTVVDRVTQGYRDGDRAGGLAAALALVGDLLREAVPGDRAGNELPDQVSQR